MSRREEIRMSDAEVAAFLEQERTVTCATLGPRGWPHLMPLWYVLRASPPGEPGPRLWAWTYASSQKALNLERDARATLQVEAGTSYDQLRGVMLECEVLVHRDTEVVRALGEQVFARYAVEPGAPAPAALPPQLLAMIDKQAPKRIAMEFVECRRASWDHRRLGGGVY
jgi:nitroimidazol reductase NimA-like FMN-containing flavoprotein (pyridoxamine 5'-phosphate oxidase superfamily)